MLQAVLVILALTTPARYTGAGAALSEGGKGGGADEAVSLSGHAISKLAPRARA